MKRMLLNSNLWLFLFLFTVIRANAQTAVTGEVKKADGEPLADVSVVIKNNGSGTVTDAKGKFSLTVPNNKTVLVFTHTGYEKREETVANRSVLIVVLKEDRGKMDEVVVIGYGTARKKDLTGSVGVVDMKDLTKAPVASFQGKIFYRRNCQRSMFDAYLLLPVFYKKNQQILHGVCQ